MSYNDENDTILYDESYDDVGHNYKDYKSYCNCSKHQGFKFDYSDNDIEMSCIDISISVNDDLGYLDTSYVDDDYDEYYILEMMYYV